MSIVVDDFHKNYGQTVAVAGLSFTVGSGEILGLVGPNGAGKTTTLRALSGIITPTVGRLLLDDHDIVDDPVAAKSVLAYVPDDPHLFDKLTVWEHFRFAASVYAVKDWKPRAEQLMVRLELTFKRHALASELSRGMRQKLAIGCGLLHDPAVLLLDEPTNGLDPRGIRTMKALIREYATTGAAIIVSSHQLQLFEDLFTTVLILHHGHVLRFGRLDDLRREVAGDARHETLEEMFIRLTEEKPTGEAASLVQKPEVEDRVQPPTSDLTQPPPGS